MLSEHSFEFSKYMWFGTLDKTCQYYSQCWFILVATNSVAKNISLLSLIFSNVSYLCESVHTKFV